jgi:hypothetical protein
VEEVTWCGVQKLCSNSGEGTITSEVAQRLMQLTHMRPATTSPLIIPATTMTEVGQSAPGLIPRESDYLPDHQFIITSGSAPHR